MIQLTGHPAVDWKQALKHARWWAIGLLLYCLVFSAAFANGGGVRVATSNSPSLSRVIELRKLKDKIDHSVDAWAEKQILGVYLDEQRDVVVIVHGRFGTPDSVRSWLARKDIGSDNIAIQPSTSMVETWRDPFHHQN